MNKWSLNLKIWAIVGLLSFAFVLSSVFSIRGLLNGKSSLDEITETLVKRDQLTSDIKDNQRVIVASTMESILRTDEAGIKRVNDRFQRAINDQEEDMKAYNDIASDAGRALLEKYQAEYKIFLESVNHSRELSKQNKNAEAAAEFFAVDERLTAMRAIINDMNKLTADRLREASDLANAQANQSILIALLMSSLSIVTSLIIAFMVLRAVTSAIALVVKNLSDSSIQVSGAATQIASSSEELSQAATEQAASLEETAASVEELNSMVAKNSENAKSTEQTSAKSQDAVNQGKQVIQKMMESMEAINRSSEGMADTVKVIEQIDKKTKVINEIVNKTELLSFNASVEAARAGEHGKGFAVVAEEVGNLARMSGAAAEEIAALLEESIRKVNQMVQDTKKNVDMGASVTRECGEVFEEIVQNVNSVSGMATEISSASQEQARGCGEITKAMTQLDQMTQQNAATSEECASAAEELSAQAEALKGAVNLLVLTVNGGNSGEIGIPEAPVKKATPVKPAGNLVQLKGPRSSPAAGAPLKKAAGSPPSYDSDGFRDV